MLSNCSGGQDQRPIRVWSKVGCEKSLENVYKKTLFFQWTYNSYEGTKEMIPARNCLEMADLSIASSPSALCRCSCMREFDRTLTSSVFKFFLLPPCPTLPSWAANTLYGQQRKNESKNRSKKSYSTTKRGGERESQAMVVYNLFKSANFTREFLTGFHKRKVERTEIKKNKAIERDKQEKLELRREVGPTPSG